MYRRGSASEYGLLASLLVIVIMLSVVSAGKGVYETMGFMGFALKGERFAAKPYQLYVDKWDDYNTTHDMDASSMRWQEIENFLNDYSENPSGKKAKNIRDAFDCNSNGRLEQSEWNDYGAHWSDPSSGGP